MPNAEYVTPLPGTLGRELSRVLEGLRANWGEGGSFAGALSSRADGLDDERVRALADAVAPGLRETHATSAELVAFVERIGGGRSDVTLRDLAAAPARGRNWRRAGVAGLRLLSGAGGALAAIAPVPGSPCPWWLGVVGAAVAYAAGNAAPGMFRRGEDRA